jgi:magnesium chelatase subunit I
LHCNEFRIPISESDFDMTEPRTFGDLKNSRWAEPPLRGRTVRDEIRANLMARLASGETLFPGIVGFEDTIIPHIVNALLARHHFILLGLRGQAKSRILRELTRLLDDRIPVVAGSEVNDDPFAPISKYARDMLGECGDATPIAWLHRDQRYVEKLATPDVTIADLIGDVDPIKAARGGHLLSDELTMHFGLLPRANRGIFAINELPDLSGKVQVGLFNIMQEGDVQIKGYPVRLPLDALLAFTANPEDYTARGKIITPLKDRIGSEIITHYPRTVPLGMEITAQEAWVSRGGRPLEVPDFVLEVIERVAFEAREDKRVDKRSGVSQRLPISVLENAVSNAERRAMSLGEEKVVPRVSDVYAAVPSITGKLELEYEGELQGGDTIARELIRRAAGRVLEERAGGADLGRIVAWFDQGGALKVPGDERAELCYRGFAVVPGLVDLVSEVGLAPKSDHARAVAACELVLEGLAAQKRISRSEELGYTRARPERREPGYGKGGISFG